MAKKRAAPRKRPVKKLTTRREIWQAVGRRVGWRSTDSYCGRKNYYGLCWALRDLWENNRITPPALRKEENLFENNRPDINRFFPYYWAFTSAGTRARKAFCRQMAKL